MNVYQPCSAINFFFFYYGDAQMINRAPLDTKKIIYNIFYGFFEQETANFLYIKKQKNSEASDD
jgi:hypothetical protein